jgi:prolyl-tRNA synthetase
MRFSELFGRTLRQAPAEVELLSHQLLLRAGMIRQLAAGIYSYLPLGWRVLHRLEQIMREEMDRIGAQEMLMPVVHPAEVWQATGRYQAPTPGPALARFRDRWGHELVLGMTHEEVIVDLLKSEVVSYRQLPFVVYQIQTRFRDEPRPRGGLIRVREFQMKDAYSCHADQASLDAFYPRIYQAYANVWNRCHLDHVAVEADTGMMGGVVSHEFMVLTEVGEDTLIRCAACGYSANVERAEFRRPDGSPEEPRSLEAVPTPETTTIEAVAAFLGVPASRTLKAVFYATEEGELVFAVVRGDLSVNEVKLSNLLGGTALRPATAEELQERGIVAGYASPIGLRGVRVVADESVVGGLNWVAGANEPGFHYVNVSYPRDFEADMVADIALARGGLPCPRCTEILSEARGIEIGHLFKLGTRYSEAAGATYLDPHGQARPIVMGSYGIGTGRLMAAIVEQHHDDKGIIWPPAVAPFQVHLVGLNLDRPEVAAAAEALYAGLQEAGVEVLFDDRAESAGVKFNDADLVGIPLRLTVSPRALAADAVEARLRWKGESWLMPRSAGIVPQVQAALAPPASVAPWQ